MRSFTAIEFTREASVAGQDQLFEETFERLVALHGPALSRLAASYTSTVSDRDDLLQDIVLAIWKALPRFRAESSERTFIFRIAHNRGLSHQAKHRTPTITPDEEILAYDPRPDPEQELAQSQQRERLLSAIRRLSAPYRQVIVLALEGLNYSEISDVLGVTENNVGARLSRAKQALREYLRENK
jgi:RNA polymerase sigma factor (sigma-70 family)